MALEGVSEAQGEGGSFLSLIHASFCTIVQLRGK
jgi:hypothetical protein